MKSSLGLGALAITAALNATPTLAQSSNISMTQEQIHSRVIELCNMSHIQKNLSKQDKEICNEYSTDGGKTWIKAAGGASILAAIGIGALIRIRKRKTEKENIADEELGDDELLQVPAMEFKKMDLDEETLPPDDEEIENESNTIDPISEADVYMAYGRDGDAEGILLNAIKKNPEKIETYTKLLELYHKTKNIAGFQDTFMHDDAIHVMNNLPENDLIRARAWGREIDPENPIYTELSTPTENVIPIEEAPAVQEIMDLGPDTIVPEIEELKPEIAPPVEDIVIAHEEINPHLVTVSENLFPTQTIAESKVPVNPKFTPKNQGKLGIDKVVIARLDTLGFGIEKSEDGNSATVRVLKDGISLEYKENSMTEPSVIKKGEEYTISNATGIFYTNRSDGPALLIRQKDGKDRYLQLKVEKK